LRYAPTSLNAQPAESCASRPVNTEAEQSTSNEGSGVHTTDSSTRPASSFDKNTCGNIARDERASYRPPSHQAQEKRKTPFGGHHCPTMTLFARGQQPDRCRLRRSIILADRVKTHAADNAAHDSFHAAALRAILGLWRTSPTLKMLIAVTARSFHTVCLRYAPAGFGGKLPVRFSVEERRSGHSSFAGSGRKRPVRCVRRTRRKRTLATSPSSTGLDARAFTRRKLCTAFVGPAWRGYPNVALNKDSPGVFASTVRTCSP
jgi:hypothetical protein